MEELWRERVSLGTEVFFLGSAFAFVIRWSSPFDRGGGGLLCTIAATDAGVRAPGVLDPFVTTEAADGRKAARFSPSFDVVFTLEVELLLNSDNDEDDFETPA